MFSSLFNQVKEGLVAATEPPPPPQSQAPPSKPAQQAEPAPADFLGGLLNVAKEVSQAMNDKNEPEVKQPPPTPEKPHDGPHISQENIALISQGLGALVNTFNRSAKEGEEEHVAKVDSQGGKVQLPSVAEAKSTPAHGEQAPPSAGGDFFSGLMSVAKEVGKAMNEKEQTPPPPPAQTNQLSQEDIAKITQGLSSLVGKVFSKGGEEGQAVKQDASGNLQQSSGGGTAQPAAQQNAAADHDFLSDLLNLAKEVGKKVTEPQGAQAGGQAAQTNAASGQDTSRINQEDLGKLMVALGPLVNTIKEKAFAKKEDAEEEVAKIDSQGGKVQLSSVPQESTGAAHSGAEQGAQAPAAGGDFLSGLMSMAKEVGKTMNEQQQPAAQPTAQPPSGPHISPEDIAKITAGLGTLGALLKDKAGDIFQKPAAAAAEKEKEKPKEEPVVDDVEGEIGRVVISGYTGDKTAEDAKKKNE